MECVSNIYVTVLSHIYLANLHEPWDNSIRNFLAFLMWFTNSSLQMSG